eukprot:7422610-Lingulodinium_polyedra.AAC.1
MESHYAYVIWDAQHPNVSTRSKGDVRKKCLTMARAVAEHRDALFEDDLRVSRCEDFARVGPRYVLNFTKLIK